MFAPNIKVYESLLTSMPPICGAQLFGQTPSQVCPPPPPNVWSPYTQANINKVGKIHRRAARLVKNDYYWRTEACTCMSHVDLHDSLRLVEIHLPSYICHPIRTSKTRIPCTLYNFPPLPLTTNTVSSHCLLYSGIIFLLRCCMF